MAKRIFPCRIEELPAIGEFILNSFKRDLDDFQAFSPVFTSEYGDGVEQKITICRDVVSSSVISKELKATTQKLNEIYTGLRIPLNKLEGYLNLCGKELDIAVKDFGLKGVRIGVSKGNVEGIINNVHTLLAHAKRNKVALAAKGMQDELITELENTAKEMDSLNVKQNDFISERGRLADDNIHLFNDLWNGLQPILKTGQAMYRGANPVKLKDYTMAQLIKRVNREKKG